MSIEVAALRAEVKANQLQLQQQYEQTGDARGLLRQRSDQVDAVLKKLWDLLDFPASLAFAAVGGYGRGELYPASDIDLLILLPQEASTPLQEKLERLVGYFWDIGLEIGHSVRTIQECLEAAEKDITVQTALFEARLITGNAKLFSTFHKRLLGHLDPLVFCEAKQIEQQERYLRYNETPYSLEPNCKESPGGLRDFQVILSFRCEVFCIALQHDLAFRNTSVWCLKEAHLIDLGMYAECRDQTDVWSFWCLNGTKATVMRVVYVPNLKTCALS
jgi:[protein-PII] uridylyltransferase